MVRPAPLRENCARADMYRPNEGDCDAILLARACGSIVLTNSVDFQTLLSPPKLPKLVEGLTERQTEAAFCLVFTTCPFPYRCAIFATLGRSSAW